MKTDARTRIWVIERCPGNKPPMRRIWKPCVSEGLFNSRSKAITWMLGLLADDYIYRATQYVPAKGK